MKVYKIDTSGSQKLTIINEDFVIGEEGRGRYCKTIPIVGTGTEVRLKLAETGVVGVACGDTDDSRCVAIINTNGGYKRGRSYDIMAPENLTVVAEGLGAFGEAGRVGSYKVYLAIMNPTASFHLIGKYGDKTYFSWDGKEMRVESHTERQARLAAEEVAAGGGKWL